ncbi:tRNA (adenosine(37)-N6)-threonylcarbamoyltransferase complex dimerization subunit type 1 TsaB [Candidatus Gottesmanbacteria bacterium RBG_16_37_8]|uniref:tRNA (Adenosine(37)-N6)-threonylcarbamoyltransferase complex dimerization subunit type 1 TsaB n=1 Tax=Candidatus Gottesmanbacteria bacterium RBG_16_37_8 TaxID=1798371 RepID=A0A1F5YQL7_9BACT|nr:MAG: tRNA (adenosine(37)-N6)-threonylcarbamoyltransferase complex dimerization subunit type 1 TsaB [Candidatus Gottesmanbacteria bacterium RBG_16_37_8]
MIKGKIKLFFDSSDRNKIIVRLYKNGKLISAYSRDQKFTSQVLLPLVDRILKENKLTPASISAVEINRGPGSYTGLKVGVAVANTFGWFLKIPVNGNKNKIINPVYK